MRTPAMQLPGGCPWGGVIPLLEVQGVGDASDRPALHGCVRREHCAIGTCKKVSSMVDTSKESVIGRKKEGSVVCYFGNHCCGGGILGGAKVQPSTLLQWVAGSFTTRLMG